VAVPGSGSAGGWRARSSIHEHGGRGSASLGEAVTAHELRDPLLSIRGAIEAALSEGPRRASDALLEGAHEELSRLAILVDELLRLGVRPAAGWVDVALESVARDAVRSSTTFSRGHRLRVSVQPPVRPVRAVRWHLETATANLVRNALRHSPQRSTVVVRVDGTLEHSAITVINAIAGGPSSSAAEAGHGLGLVIARSLAEACGGELRTSASDDLWTASLRVPAVPASEGAERPIVLGAAP
jgi:signal transduction histidine kinase